MGMPARHIASVRAITARQVRNVQKRDGALTEDAALRRIAMAVSLRHGPRWLVEVRDSVVALLLALQMDSEDVPRTLSWPRQESNVQHRIGRIPASVASRVSLAAHYAVVAVRPLLDAERTRRETEPRKRRPRRQPTAQRPRTIAMVPPEITQEPAVAVA
jgi:hypothetical protein